MSQTCVNCKRVFTPQPHVKNQHYCQKRACQKARKRKWQQEKLRSDPDYGQNQAAAQAAWSKRHRDYWRKYREQHPEYGARNRLLQRERNARRREADRIAKMDAFKTGKSLEKKPFGLFQLIPFSNQDGIAKMDAWVVEIRSITGESGIVPPAVAGAQ